MIVIFRVGAVVQCSLLMYQRNEVTCHRSSYISAFKSFTLPQESNTEIFIKRNRYSGAVLDRHLRSPPLNKPFSIVGEPHSTDYIYIYTACVVYISTIIDLSVGEIGGYLPPLR